jgi:hypothetical protein
MLRTSGSAIARLNAEKIKPLVDRGVEILSRNGRLPKIKVDGKQVSIAMQSPLAKAEAMEDFNSFQVWFAQMSQLPPEVFALSARLENIPNWTATKLGLPTNELARTSEEIKAASQAIIQQAQGAQIGQ